MPIYEYECDETGEKFERFMSVHNSDLKHILCDIHGLKHTASKIISQTAYPSYGTPTVIYRNPRTGDTRVAVMKNQQAPTGYERIELKTPIDRSRAEKEMQERANAENEYVTERNRYLKEETQKNRHADTRARMNTLVKDSDNPSAAAALLEAGMKRSRKKKLPPKKTEFHFAVNHDDSSNINKG